MADVAKFVDKAYEEMSFADLAKAPVAALQGVSDADAEALTKALNIKTIADLATNKYVLWAQAIQSLSH
jgi:ABC-type amino acid transport substrate-binding protein